LSGLEASLMGVRGEVVSEVAQVELDLAESLALGEISEALGHASEGGFRAAAEES
jgi:hypothetical protein